MVEVVADADTEAAVRVVPIGCCCLLRNASSLSVLSQLHTLLLSSPCNPYGDVLVNRLIELKVRSTRSQVAIAVGNCGQADKQRKTYASAYHCVYARKIHFRFEEHSYVRRKQLRFSVLYASWNDAFVGHGPAMSELSLEPGILCCCCCCIVVEALETEASCACRCCGR